jgi:transcriptional regulator with GAF, ATPase, and Fis domain
MEGECVMDAHAVEFAEFARTLSEERGINGAAERVAEGAVRCAGADHAGVLLAERGKWDLIAASDTAAAKIDRLQITLGEGPALEASAARAAILVPDVAAATSWPEWSLRVAGMGVGCMVAASLHTARHSLGAVTVYSGTPSALGEQAKATVAVLAGHAAIVLDRLVVETGLQETAAARNIIGQAQGVLMERYGLDPRAALDLLRRHSEDSESALRAVAEDVVATRQLPE